MCMGILLIGLSQYHIHACTHGGQTKLWDLPKTAVTDVESHHMGATKQSCVLCKSSQYS